MTTDIEARAQGMEFGEMVMAGITDWQQNAPRTRQSTDRVLGMSEMGGCREYIRATIAGDPKTDSGRVKWAAFLGTATGDFIENILKGMGFDTQEDVSVTLERTGVTVKGHLDLRGKNMVGDLKSKNGIEEVKRDGPSFKNKAQIAGYLMGLVQEGKIDEDGTGHLIYFDRSGGTNEIYTWSCTVEMARKILDAVEDRLVDVQNALASGLTQSYLRDEPESWCYAVDCPFYKACWDGYTPTGKIEHPRQLDAVQRLVAARAEEKAQKELREGARRDLAGVEGVTPDGTTVRWIITETPSGGYSERLDVRVKK